MTSVCPLCACSFDLAYVTDDSAGETAIYCGGCHSAISIEELAA